MLLQQRPLNFDPPAQLRQRFDFSAAAELHGLIDDVAVEEESLPEDVEATHRSLFDGTLQGISLKDAPAFSFQGHPEASPGPHDLLPLFERFIADMEEVKRNSSAAALLL